MASKKEIIGGGLAGAVIAAAGIGTGVYIGSKTGEQRAFTPPPTPLTRPAEGFVPPAPATLIPRTETPEMPNIKNWLKQPYDVAGGIPYNGREWHGDVAPDEIEVFTGGPMTVEVIDSQGKAVKKAFPGGENRGTVILFVGKDKVSPIRVDGVIPGANWHGAYRPVESPQKSWQSLLDDRLGAMKAAPNCTPGKGCEQVDFLVIEASTKQVLAEGQR